MRNQIGMICCALICVYSLYVGIRSLLIFQRLKRTGIATVASVVDKIEEKGSRGSTYWKIKLRIELLGGTFVEGFAKNALLNSSKDELGDEIPVIYNSDKPDEFVINRSRERILNPIVWILTGVGVLTVGLHYIARIF